MRAHRTSRLVGSKSPMCRASRNWGLVGARAGFGARCEGAQRAVRTAGGGRGRSERGPPCWQAPLGVDHARYPPSRRAPWLKAAWSRQTACRSGQQEFRHERLPPRCPRGAGFVARGLFNEIRGVDATSASGLGQARARARSPRAAAIISCRAAATPDTPRSSHSSPFLPSPTRFRWLWAVLKMGREQQSALAGWLPIAANHLHLQGLSRRSPAQNWGRRHLGWLRSSAGDEQLTDVSA